MMRLSIGHCLLTADSVRVQEVVGAVDGLSAAGGETLASPEEGVRARLVTISIRLTRFN